jgi:hypothetical protein
MVSKFREGEVVSYINVPPWQFPASEEVRRNEPEGGDNSK